MRWLTKHRCPHSNLRPIYGDEIIVCTPDFNRLQCRDCRRYLNGPVALAAHRSKETA